MRIRTDSTMAVLIPAIMGKESEKIPQSIRITAQAMAKPVPRLRILLSGSSVMRHPVLEKDHKYRLQRIIVYRRYIIPVETIDYEEKRRCASVLSLKFLYRSGQWSRGSGRRFCARRRVSDLCCGC